jgi:ABC-type Fe3+ transport system permease subunit
MAKRYQVPTTNRGGKSKSQHLDSTQGNTNRTMERKSKGKVFAILSAIIGYVAILLTLFIYTIHRAANTFVFWQEFPRYKVWLHNTTANMTGIAITAIVITAIFSTLAASILLVIYLLTKALIARNNYKKNL